ncbi:hypothetical protein DSO57_1025770 [Entomophthora muscae]|nr:hypothetical protein DSO57_1025770 [Entomophthora muscae]
MYMQLILIVCIFGLQILVFTWKRRHYKSYQMTSLAGLWIFPPVFFYFVTPNSTFISIWCLFSLLNCWVIHLASKSPLHHLTPRLVYKWFSVTHQISFVVGVVGYVAMMTLIFFVPTSEVNPDEPASISLPFLFLMYGLYFGVLSRDFAEFCSNQMAATLGFYVKDGLPNKQLNANICAICGGFLRLEASTPHINSGMVYDDEIQKLECQHEFHEKCIRGWCIIGKKDSCPYCHEKVSLKALSHNPWDTQQELYLNLLDYLRYLIVWVPILSIIVTGSYKLFNLD